MGTRELIIKSQRGENDQFLCRSNDTAWDYPPEQADRIYPSLLPSRMAQVWGFLSALHRRIPMAGACGLPTIPRAAQVFVSVCGQGGGA